MVSYSASKAGLIGMVGSLDEAADIIAFALSPAAAFTTAFTFDLSGGRATY